MGPNNNNFQIFVEIDGESFPLSSIETIAELTTGDIVRIKKDDVEEAIRKQIPKAPVKGTFHEDNSDNPFDYMENSCPECGAELPWSDSCNFCPTCGQKIDWGEENDG